MLHMRVFIYVYIKMHTSRVPPLSLVRASRRNHHTDVTTGPTNASTLRYVTR